MSDESPVKAWTRTAIICVCVVAATVVFASGGLYRYEVMKVRVPNTVSEGTQQFHDEESLIRINKITGDAEKVYLK